MYRNMADIMNGTVEHCYGWAGQTDSPMSAKVKSQKRSDYKIPTTKTATPHQDPPPITSNKQCHIYTCNWPNEIGSEEVSSE